MSEVEGINHFRTGKKPLSCSQTQKDLKKTRANKSFTCTQCGKRSTYKHHLDVHMRVHTGEKPFTCDQCGKSFSRSSTLKIHMNIHTREKLYTCDQCSKTFLWASVLGSVLRTSLITSEIKRHIRDDMIQLLIIWLIRFFERTCC